MNIRNSALAVLLCSPCAANEAVQGRLAAAETAGASALSSASLEKSSAFAQRAMEGGKIDAMTPVDARGSSGSSVSNFTSAPVRAKAVVPAPLTASRNSTASDDHAGLFMLGALVAPALGAIAGAVVGGVPGAITGGLVGVGVGIILLAIGICRALRRVFNP